MNRAFICSPNKHYSVGLERDNWDGSVNSSLRTGSSELNPGFVDSQPLTVPTRQESIRNRPRPRQCEVLRQSSRPGPGRSEDRLSSAVSGDGAWGLWEWKGI